MRRPLLLLPAFLLALAALYAAAGYWLLPGYVEDRLVAEAARLGYDLRMARVRVDPFRLNVEAEDAELAVAGRGHLSARRVRADLRLASLLSRDWLPERISLPHAALEVAEHRIEPLEAAFDRRPGGYRVAVSGALELQGALDLQPLMLDAEVVASHLPLAAVQPWLGEVARLEVQSGSLSGRGKLRFEGAGRPRLAYAGALSLQDVVVRGAEEREPPLATWRALDAREVKLTFAPGRLEVGELLLERPTARLVVGADQRTNLAGIAKGKQAEGAEAAPFPIAVRRLAVSDGRLDFADLSIEPRFATTIRALSGTVSGLGSDGDDQARLELNGRVDPYGEARIRGVVNPFAPKARTAVTMSFRNLEMRALTPYSAKFAGYRIEAGKLSADLRYRVRDSQLAGDNKIVIDRLVLGERVADTPAPELPIELALALLTDANGRIDLGLPVRGDLSDPDFSFADLARKALGNLVGKIASAPLRLLGSMLGGRGRDLDGVVFEPGSARLSPPQEENAAALARALAARPQLAVAVRGGYDSEADAAALRSLALRRELVKRSGFRLPGNADPGSLDPADPRTRQAMETLFIEHGGTALRMREIRRAAESERRYLRALAEDIAARLPLPAQAGEALAQRRAEAVRSALVARGVAPQRVRIGEAEQTTAEKDGVRTALEVDAG